ncbi:MAG: hypothetical protein JWN67_2158 [Actinomycetia bacterium]|nr:hypothetical protein [Actinomycetes bacterium]
MELDGPALDWVRAELGPFTHVRRRAGGVASTIHEVDAGGRRFIVRLVPPRPEVPGHDPEAEVRNEARALDALRHLGLAPDLVAVDPAGERAGVAASIVTCLPGEVVVVPLDVDVLAEAVLAIHEVDVDLSAFPTFEPWADVGVPPGGPDGLVHRDLHPGNVLVHGRRLGGIVDWVHACRGPIEVDVSRCRVEVAVLAGIEAADAFLERCRPVVPDYDRAWDALVVAELRPGVHDLLAFNAVGASLTVEGIRRTFDALALDAEKR